MSFAHVDSIDALKHLRSAIWKFAEAANLSLSEAESDLQRTLNWLEHDARTQWQGHIKRRTLALNLAKESLRSKLSITRRDGSKPSAVEEQKAVALAQSRLHHAQTKLEQVKQYAKVFQREALAYRALMQRFVNTVRVEVPDAAAHLDGLIDSLATYTALEEVGSTVGLSGTEQPAASMTRPEPVDPDSLGRSRKRDSSPPESNDALAEPRPDTAQGIPEPLVRQPGDSGSEPPEER